MQADWYVNILSCVSGGLQAKCERGPGSAYESVAGGRFSLCGIAGSLKVKCLHTVVK